MLPSLQRCLVLPLLVALLSAPEAAALVIYGTGPGDTDNTLNTTAPANGAPWQNVAQFGVNNAAGIYLGHGFVLTANHVNVVNSGIVIHGVSYNRDTSFTPLQVTEDNTATPYADVVDMKLVKILGNPALPALPVVQKLPLNFSTTGDLNAVGTMIGWGVGKGGVISDQGWSWGGGGTYAQRWGSSSTLAGAGSVSYPGYQYEAIGTSFLRALGSNAAQVTLGDSGGGLFQQFGGTWKLAGLITTVSAYQANAALYDGLPATEGDQPDLSLYVRLARYAHLLRYENWANTKFGSPTASESADADGDGVSNLFEYAFHTDPNSVASFSAPVPGVAPGFVTLTYKKLMSATDLSYVVEATDSLLPADWQPVSVTEEVVSSTGLAWTIKAKIAITTETQKFLRLRVTRLP